MKRRQYNVGIDVGLNSVGLAAIEVDEQGLPVRILNMQSVIHDGGVDPQKNKEAITRKNQSGVARRTRRMRRRRKARLLRLDNLLERYDYPIIEPDSLTMPFEEWQVRSELVERYIEDEERRRENLSIAMRHMARHRGWRNSYRSVESLLAENPYSAQYQELLSRAETRLGESLPKSLTPAQIVVKVLSAGYTEAPRLRTRVSSDARGTIEGLLPVRLMQDDNANELKRIFEMQRVDEAEWRELFKCVFEVKSPKGSATERVGKDPLDPAQRRALKASLSFQRYRIANVITNLRISESGRERPLTVGEKQQVFGMLSEADDLTWSDVAVLLGLKRSQLRGVGKMTADGDERISSRPPCMTTVQRINSADKKIREPLLAWWNEASIESREAMIRLLSNTVDVDTVRERLEYADAIEFIDALDETMLTKLDAIDLPSGRAAYGAATLDKLTDRMLTTDDDLHAARKVEFGVSDSWRPPVDPIGTPVGNPAVDRVLKIVNRYLMNCRQRWGEPRRVQIEHVRNSFGSVASARKSKNDYERNVRRRAEYREDLVRQLHTDVHLDKVRESDIRRQEAIQRQNGQCLYCGREIAFSSCEMDHIVPRNGVGSTNTRVNLAAVCAECNRMKSNTPFAIWAKTQESISRGVSLSGAEERVRHFVFNPRSYASKEQQAFRREVLGRLRQTEKDEAIDNRSIESVAWMADELRRRIDGYFNYRENGESNKEIEENKQSTTVAVFQGRVTAAARKASGIDGRIHFIGAATKTRLDRRHHAVDAAVIAMMNHSAAKLLMERDSLRESQWLLREPETWRNYPWEGVAGYDSYQRWLSGMEKLLDMMNNMLDEDHVPVMQLRRLTLGNSIAHDATIHKLTKVHLGEAMDAELIRRASTPALYCALTRLPDYSSEKGLPADRSRSIRLHDTYLQSDDYVGFFSSNAAQIMVQDGSADIGSAIHHARIYRYWKTNAKGVRKYSYGMIRVFQADLKHARREDLFTCPLPPQSVSMRYGDKPVVAAIERGEFEYLGYLTVGDEIVVDFSQAAVSGQISEMITFFNGEIDTSCKHWVVDGFFSASRLRLHPRTLAGEGLDKLKQLNKTTIPDGVEKIVAGAGWLPAVNALANYKPEVIRRNVFGEIRYRSSAGLPVSWSWC